LREKIDGTAEHPDTPPAQNYWFKCPVCNYDWATWLAPSITFVSLSFITDQCPNCQKKQVPAYRVGSER
jgi:hypothetical protein